MQTTPTRGLCAITHLGVVYPIHKSYNSYLTVTYLQKGNNNTIKVARYVFKVANLHFPGSCWASTATCLIGLGLPNLVCLGLPYCGLGGVSSPGPAPGGLNVPEQLRHTIDRPVVGGPGRGQLEGQGQEWGRGQSKGRGILAPLPQTP